MTRLMTSVLAVVALLAAATTVLRSHCPTTNGVGRAGMPTLHEFQGAAGTDKLPIENFEDRSLVYPREIEH